MALRLGGRHPRRVREWRLGGPRRSYQRTADELDDLTARLARLLGKG